MKSVDGLVALLTGFLIGLVLVFVMFVLLRTICEVREAAASEPGPQIELVIEDVAKRAEVAPWVIRWRLGRESDWQPGVVRYCLLWDASGRECQKETDCRRNCTRKEVWKNRLDVGLFQLRDAPSWSWRRWWNKNNPDDKRDAKCLLDPVCAADIAVAAILYLKGRAANERWKCKTPKVGEIAWLAWWNGCGCYRKAWKLWKQREKGKGAVI